MYIRFFCLSWIVVGFLATIVIASTQKVPVKTVDKQCFTDKKGGIVCYVDIP